MARTFLRAALAALIVNTTVLVAAAPAGAVAGFGDVPDQQFYTSAVQWMFDNDITTGTSDTCFSPTDSVTRGQAAAFMWRMEGEPDAPPHSFDDVVADYQQGPVSWMAHNEITNGTSPTTYSPDQVLTRGQLAALLWRLAGAPAASGHPFTDVEKSWQQSPIAWMVSTSPIITTGTSATTFSPDEPVTRGQLATFFWRYKKRPSVTVDLSHPTCSTSAATVPSSIPTLDTRNCSDFPSQADAQAWFDYFFPFVKDIANLDGDDDRQACEDGDPAP